MFWAIGRGLAWSVVVLWALGLLWWLPGARDAGDALGIVLALSLAAGGFIVVLGAVWSLVDLLARLLRLVPE